MMEAFRLGGWGMYPTSLFGVLAIAAAVWYARSPQRQRLVLFCIASTVALGAGVLGLVTGIMATLRHSAGMPDQSAMIAQGTFESLNNLSLALVLFILGGIVAGVGAWRAATPRRGEPAVPVEAT
jgi:hypothetical protein